MGKGHLEDCIRDPELVVLGNCHDVHVPHQHQCERDNDADEDVDEGVDDGGGVLGEAGGVAREEVGSGGADLEEGGSGGGEYEDPGEEEEEERPSTGQNARVPENYLTIIDVKAIPVLEKPT